MAVGAGAIWVTPNGLDANVLRLDSVSLRRVASIPGMPRNPMGPYLTASAGNVWVANSDERSKNGGRTVVEIDPATNKVVAELEVGPSPQSIVAGFGAVWTGDHDAPSLSRLDPMTGRRVTIRLTTEQIPHSLAVGAGFVWIGAPHSRVLVRVDPATNRVTGSFTYDVHPGSMAVDSHGWLWIAPSPHVDDVNNSLLVVDPASGGIMRAIDTGARPMALVAHDDEIWVATRSPSGLMAFYAFPGAPPTGSR
jgi:DNA-binding beta-propeller fold protein YncE